MLMTQLASNFLFVISLMVVGSWLETIGGKHGFMDELLTPLPLGLSGGVLVFLERAMA
jgi:hypothetical protein